MPQTTRKDLAEGDYEIGRHQMLCRRASREDFLDEVLMEGRSLYEHPYRASADIRLQSTRQWHAQAWPMREDIGGVASGVRQLIDPA
ncbi:hypothetical protein [Pararhizobium arenae]|uniref:hypothetical protein n=1 Tax=Pararhizobium arenae TaxID=1856850 RepID=UPI00094B417D|nr:hypothetical protein [Pararhizobium arenae]